MLINPLGKHKLGALAEEENSRYASIPQFNELEYQASERASERASEQCQECHVKFLIAQTRART